MTISSYNSPTITGTQVNYYLICQRKLWLFSHNITMEHTSEAVEIGSLVHKQSYTRRNKEIVFDGIKIDFFDKNHGVIHEVKKSRKMEEAHYWQLKYYIYYFKKLGLFVSGKIDYPLIRRTQMVELSADDEAALEKMLDDIVIINKQELPPPVIKAKICKSCSYYELCYV
jgi:CRISPR-associated exonuclease Cas4